MPTPGCAEIEGGKKGEGAGTCEWARQKILLNSETT